MAIWILLSLVSGLAFCVAVSINKPILITATAFSTALGLLMLVLRIMLMQRIKREIGRR